VRIQRLGQVAEDQRPGGVHLEQYTAPPWRATHRTLNTVKSRLISPLGRELPTYRKGPVGEVDHATPALAAS